MFADDTGVAVTNLFDGMFAMTQVLLDMAATAGLRLNSNKSKVLYYGSPEESDVREALRWFGLFAEVQIAARVRYLGVEIGPSSGEVR